MAKRLRLIMPSAYRGHLPQPLWLAATVDENLLNRLLHTAGQVPQLSPPLEVDCLPVQWQPKSGFCAEEAQLMCTPTMFFFRSLNRMTGTRISTRSLPVKTLNREFRDAGHQDMLFLSNDVATLKAIYYGTSRALCTSRFAL